MITSSLRLPWAPPALAAVPDLSTYDRVVIATSAGKDSQTALRNTVLECRRQGYPLERVRVVHADLGRVEWPGVVELARAHAKHYGLELDVISRTGRTVQKSGKCYARGERYGDLLDHIRRMGFWPRRDTRYCTSDHKRDQIVREIGVMVRALEIRGRATRVLDVVGMRAQESPLRAKMLPLARDRRASSSRREIDIWLPIHGWSEDEVWRDIWASGVPWHPAYDWGMPRLSCSICVFAGIDALRIAVMMRPELGLEYAAVEREIGHLFREHFSIADLVDEVRCSSPLELARRHGAARIAAWRD